MKIPTQSLFAFALLSVTQAGCFAVADLDRFEFDDATGGMCSGTNASAARDLNFLMRDMPHLGKHTEVRVIGTSGAQLNRVEALAIYEGLPSRDLTVFMPNAIREGAFRVDFWCDVTVENRTLDPAPVDHSWSVDGVTVDPTHQSSSGVFQSGCIQFDHQGSFAPLLNTTEFPIDASDRQDMQIQLTGMDEFGDVPLEMRVIVPGSTRRTIGMFRYQLVRHDPDLEIRLPGIATVGDPYDLEFYIDMNDNLAFDIGTDRSWIVEDVVVSTAEPILTVNRPAVETPLSY